MTAYIGVDLSLWIVKRAPTTQDCFNDKVKLRQGSSHIHLSNYQVLVIITTAHDFIAQSLSAPLFNQ